MLLFPHGLQGLHSLQALVPNLLRHEVETAMEQLDFTWDRAYAWDMFLDMMVRELVWLRGRLALICTESLLNI